MAEYQRAMFLSLVVMCSQALVFPKMIGHSPDMMEASSKYINRKKWIEHPTSWLHEEDLPHRESWYGSRGFDPMVE